MLSLEDDKIHEIIDSLCVQDDIMRGLTRFRKDPFQVVFSTCPVDVIENAVT